MAVLTNGVLSEGGEANGFDSLDCDWYLNAERHCQWLRMGYELSMEKKLCATPCGIGLIESIRVLVALRRLHPVKPVC